MLSPHSDSSEGWNLLDPLITVIPAKVGTSYCIPQSDQYLYRPKKVYNFHEGPSPAEGQGFGMTLG